MKTKSPGIFIPFFEKKSSAVKQFTEIPSQKKCQVPLSVLLQQAGIPNEVDIACEVRYMPQEQGIKQTIGCMVTLKHPQQMEYVKALKVLNEDSSHDQAATIDAYTVPISGVISAGLGQICKTLYCQLSDTSDIKEYKTHIDKIAEVLKQLYEQTCLCFPLTICREDNCITLQATSPIKLNDNYAAWQNFIGKFLRKAGYTPLFYTTWSTNSELEAYYKEKSRQLQERQQREYEAKISALNQ